MKNKDSQHKLMSIIVHIIPVIILGIILSIAGRCHFNKVEKYGVWTFNTVDKKTVTTNGGSYRFYFSIKGKRYKGATAGGNDPSVQKGRRFFMMVIPDDPTEYICFSDTLPDWFTAEAPYNGWRTRPTEEELWEIMKAQGAEPGKAGFWKPKPDKKKMRKNRMVYGILLVIFGAIFFSIAYNLKKENEKNKRKKQEEIIKE